MTRDLDEACARAMGWTKPSERSRCDRCGWRFSPATEDGCTPTQCCFRSDRNLVRADEPARYSADPATDAEKVAWLHKRGPVELMIYPKISTAICWGGKGTRPSKVEGATMTEALANLVIAVDKAEAKR